MTTEKLFSAYCQTGPSLENGCLPTKRGWMFVAHPDKDGKDVGDAARYGIAERRGHNCIFFDHS